MPSIEGTEIDVALQNDFREENLHVVDRNPAIVAHLKRRYPRIHTYGVDIVRACERIADEGYTIGAANFDLCSNSNLRTWALFESIGKLGGRIFSKDSLFSVTLLRGREQSWDGLTAVITYPKRWPMLPISKGDSVRVALTGYSVESGFAADDVPMTVAPLTAGVYRSTAGTQTMLWCIYRLVSYGLDLQSKDRDTHNLDVTMN